MEKDNNRALSIALTAGTWLLYAYVIVWQVLSVYWWWKMMKADSFFMGIFIDPFIAEFKALLWPFFI